MNAATSEPRKFSPSPRPTTSGELRRAADDPGRVLRVDGDQRERAVELRADPLHRLGQVDVRGQLQLEQLGGDLGVGLRDQHELVGSASIRARSSAKFSMIPLCTSATRPPEPEVRVRVDVVGRAVGGPAGVADAGRRRPAAGRRRSPSRGWRACRRFFATAIDVRRRPARSRRSRSRGTPAAGGRRSRRPAPAALRRTRRSRTWWSTLATGPDVPPAIIRACPRRRASGALGRGRESSPYLELDRERLGRPWAARPSSPLTADEIASLRGLGDALDLDEVEQVYLPLSRLLSLYVEAAGRLHREQEAFLHQPHAAAHAVRDRPRRVGRGRQVDHRPRAAADARALARAPQRRAGHHRRVPLPQRRARAPRAAAAQGLPGVLRPRGRCCASWSTSSPARTRSRRRRTPTSSTTSSRTRRSSSSGPTS